LHTDLEQHLIECSFGVHRKRKMNQEWRNITIRDLQGHNNMHNNSNSNSNNNNSAAFERMESTNSFYSRTDSSNNNKQRAVSLDSSDTYSSAAAFSRESSMNTTFNMHNDDLMNSKKQRSLSAGGDGLAIQNGANNMMNPLRFEEIDLKLTPLSSLRSCSEFQKLQKSNSNSSWRNHTAAGDKGADAMHSKSTLGSLYNYFFKSPASSSSSSAAAPSSSSASSSARNSVSSGTNSGANNANNMNKTGNKLPTGAAVTGKATVNPGTQKSAGLIKEKLKAIDEDERSFFVESMTQRYDYLDDEDVNEHATTLNDSQLLAIKIRGPSVRAGRIGANSASKALAAAAAARQHSVLSSVVPEQTLPALCVPESEAAGDNTADGSNQPGGNGGYSNRLSMTMDAHRASVFGLDEHNTNYDDDDIDGYYNPFNASAAMRASTAGPAYDALSQVIYTPAPPATSSSARTSRHRPTMSSSFSSTHSYATNYTRASSTHSSASLIGCMPSASSHSYYSSLFPSSSGYSSSRHSSFSLQQKHRKSIEDDSREENMKLQNQIRRRYERKNSFLESSASALDVLFGFKYHQHTTEQSSSYYLYHDTRGMPMEIELKTIKTFGNQTWYISADGEINAQTHNANNSAADSSANNSSGLNSIVYVDEERDSGDSTDSPHNNVSNTSSGAYDGAILQYVPFAESRGTMPRSNLSIDTSSPHPNVAVGLSPDGRRTPLHAHSQHNQRHEANEIALRLTPLELLSPYNVDTWFPAARYVISSFSTFCATYVCSASDDHFYEQLRIQPFGFGAYLRGMLWAGFSSLFFTLYSLMLWPSAQAFAAYNTSFGSAFVVSVVHAYLWVQVVLNVLQLPLRVFIHIKCWESSRTIDVEYALTVLRTMLHSDVWIINRFVGRVQDCLSIAFLVASEYYLQTHGRALDATLMLTADASGYIPNSSVVGAVHEEANTVSDPLYPIIVSLCASTLLALTMRACISTVFALSCHDPGVLAEARRRGLSKLDTDVLPTFVFSTLEEVNNHDCSICLCDFEMGECLIALPCAKKHSFHANCIRTWLQRQNSCPLCQRMV
jgi:hypothetical protein